MVTYAIMAFSFSEYNSARYGSTRLSRLGGSPRFDSVEPKRLRVWPKEDQRDENVLRQLGLPLPLRSECPRAPPCRPSSGRRVGCSLRGLLARAEPRRGGWHPGVGRAGPPPWSCRQSGRGRGAREAAGGLPGGSWRALRGAPRPGTRSARSAGPVRGARRARASTATASSRRWTPGGRSRFSRPSTPTRSSVSSAFGVPTFVSGDHAVFVRLMSRPVGDGALAISTIERVLDLIGDWPELNEFKHTTVFK